MISDTISCLDALSTNTIWFGCDGIYHIPVDQPHEQFVFPEEVLPRGNAL